DLTMIDQPPSQSAPRRAPVAPAGLSAQARRLPEAMALHLRGEGDAAARIYREIITAEPGNFDANHLLGAVLLQQRQFAEAERFIAKALTIIPDNPAALDNHGIALIRLKRFDEALASHDRAIALKPEFAEAHNNRALLLRDAGRLDEALAGFERA